MRRTPRLNDAKYDPSTFPSTLKLTIVNIEKAPVVSVGPFTELLSRSNIGLRIACAHAERYRIGIATQQIRCAAPTPPSLIVVFASLARHVHTAYFYGYQECVRLQRDSPQPPGNGYKVLT